MPINSGSFGVTKGNTDPSGPSVTPVPDPMPITQEKTPFVSNTNNVQGGSSSGGSGIGGILGPIGSIIGGLFAQGGPVGLARGGMPQYGNYFADSTPLEMGNYIPTQPNSNRMNHNFDWHSLSSIPNPEATPQGTPSAAPPQVQPQQNKPQQGFATPLPPGALDPRGKGEGGGGNRAAMRDSPRMTQGAPQGQPQMMPPQGQPQGQGFLGRPNVQMPLSSAVNSGSSAGTYYVPPPQMAPGGYASGGQVKAGSKGNTKGLPQPKLDPMDAPDTGASNNNHNNALATGYLVGAYHQKKFGGTPHTLANAAEEIKAMLSGNPHGQSQMTPQGMATGGSVNDTTPAVTPQSSADDQLAQQALLSALGLDESQSNQQQQQKPQGLAVGGPPIPQGGQNMIPNGTPPQMPPMGGPPQGQPPMAPQGAAPQGQPQQPPLKPGQTFQGDGSVKGPGGPTDDSIPARLSNGEFVFSEPSVQFFGVDKLTKMNEQGKQGFMQAMAQVDANQPQGDPNAAPQSQSPMPAPNGPPQMPQPPMQQAQGGAVMRAKGSGYCGL